MRHLRLSLSGFLGILAAKGTGTITLDLEHQTGQLIALTGRNGAGKTTLVDNLHPYLTMPSRARLLVPLHPFLLRGWPQP